MFTIAYCKTKKGYEAKPTKQIQLDLKQVSSIPNTTIIADAALAAVIKIDQQELLIHQYGAILFKTLQKENKEAKTIAEQLAKKVYTACLKKREK